MPDEPDPPRKVYGFKAAEFVAVNPPRPPAPEAPTTGSPRRLPTAADTPITVEELSNQANAGVKFAPAPMGPTPPDNNAGISVHELLRQAKAFGPKPPDHDVFAVIRSTLALPDLRRDEIVPKPQLPSKRKRDYWLLMLGVNGLTASSLLVVGVNTVSVSVVLSAVVFFSTAITWIIWVLMDKY